ncbi:hypothetical protein PF005_g1856 [Phytophthora fragariae]|uniref:Uncharacterized protein n=2 Tax=Phytophthora TaxID=4783 RepID=A0A6A3FSQ0_9STRA|nr:hypothetical protein PF003_g29196 [Phytophthora fragariae]KAE9046944.1 hypothetical protein PR002_g1357 [Phytophthora rubi]KAE8947441.1 hypothetical protein PF009_g2954 [Phytophthora fragariae]KAE9027322.1 hypothetical protein PF011_g2095 [Phytophthora fragariae]KAE9051540.1 hypothetical protein PR001_g1367 [Phytophthora rubi]
MQKWSDTQVLFATMRVCTAKCLCVHVNAAATCYITHCKLPIEWGDVANIYLKINVSIALSH